MGSCDACNLAIGSGGTMYNLMKLKSCVKGAEHWAVPSSPAMQVRDNRGILQKNLDQPAF